MDNDEIEVFDLDRILVAIADIGWRLANLDQRIGNLDHRLANIETRVKSVEDIQAGQQETIQGLLAMFRTVQEGLGRHDAAIERLQPAKPADQETPWRVN